MPADDRPLFPGAAGDLWSRWQYRNWRGRVWKPTMTALAEATPPQPQLAKTVPYDCRGSFVTKARTAVEELEKRELDVPMAYLLRIPTLFAAVRVQAEEDPAVAVRFYTPSGEGRPPGSRRAASRSCCSTGAIATDPAGSYGAYVTTDQLGFAFGDVTASLTGNSLMHSSTGLLVTQTEPTPGQSAGGQATVTATGNTIHSNGAGANGQPGTTVEAQNNWWGCTQGPNMGHCDTAVGTVSFTPWLTAKP
jgi:hypothetical protein